MPRRVPDVFEEESLSAASLLEAGRKAYGQSAWGSSRTGLRAADAESPLGPEDLQRLATAAHLTGDDQAAVEAMGMARYQQAELLRLRGDLSRAELGYREAGEMGHPVQPGLVLLRLAQGRVEEAAATIRRVPAETGDDLARRSRVLAAHVEVMLASDDVAAARAGADEMTEISAAFASPYLAAVAGQATGAVLLAEGEPQAACAVLRRASALWQEVEVPYDAARARCLLAQACRAVGDDDTADLELDAARRVFTRLRAAPALAEVARLADDRAGGPPGPLARESSRCSGSWRRFLGRDGGM